MLCWQAGEAVSCIIKEFKVRRKFTLKKSDPNHPIDADRENEKCEMLTIWRTALATRCTARPSQSLRNLASFPAQQFGFAVNG